MTYLVSPKPPEEPQHQCEWGCHIPCEEHRKNAKCSGPVGFWYLGSPYSKYPGGLPRAHFLACLAAGRLIRAGIPVFSPIAHSHPISNYADIDPFDHDIWLPADAPIMRAARGIIVLKLDGWAASYGLTKEIEHFAEVGKPVVYMEPGEVPAELRS